MQDSKSGPEKVNTFEKDSLNDDRSKKDLILTMKKMKFSEVASDTQQVENLFHLINNEDDLNDETDLASLHENTTREVENLLHLVKDERHIREDEDETDQASLHENTPDHESPLHPAANPAVSMSVPPPSRPKRKRSAKHPQSSHVKVKAKVQHPTRTESRRKPTRDRERNLHHLRASRGHFAKRKTKEENKQNRSNNSSNMFHQSPLYAVVLFYSTMLRLTQSRRVLA